MTGPPGWDPLGLLDLAREGRAARPVFIVGAPRSGTSLLYRLLQQQPAFGPDPVHLVESNLVQRLVASPGPGAEAAMLRNHLGYDDDAWRRFLVATAPLRFVRRLAWQIRPVPLTSLAVATLLGVGIVARAYVGSAVRARAVRRYVEKSPHNTEFSGHLLRWFPGCLLVHLTRPPIDTYTSYLRRGAEDGWRAHWAAMDIDAFVDRYRRDGNAALEWSTRRPDAFRLVRYQDLTADPRSTVESICRFAGEAFDPDAIGAPPSTGTAPDPLVWQDAVTSTKDWRAHVSADGARRIEQALGPLLDRLGHDPQLDEAP